MKPKIQYRIVFSALLLLCSSSLSGCGSSSDDDIEFSGTVSRPEDVVIEPSLVAREPLAGLQVCALGECAMSDALGGWMFAVDDDVFEGGDVLFSFSGGGFDTSFTVRDVSSDADFVELDFLLSRSGEVDLIGFSEEDDGDFSDEADELGEDIEDESEDVADTIEQELDEL